MKNKQEADTNTQEGNNKIASNSKRFKKNKRNLIVNLRRK